MSRNARLGVLLFFVYLFFYAGFVFINAFAPKWMELTPAAGVNLAIWYGFGLIVGAFVLAMIYGILCSRPEQRADTVSQRHSSTASTHESKETQS